MHSGDLHRGALLMIVSGLLFSTMGALIEIHFDAAAERDGGVFDPRLPGRGP